MSVTDTSNGAAAPARRNIDLDAARAARREQRAKQDPPTITFLGVVHKLPAGLTADVIDLVGDVMRGDPSAITGSIRTILGGDAYEEVKRAAAAEGEPLELEDVMFLLEGVLDVYGVTLPESKASG